MYKAVLPFLSFALLAAPLLAQNPERPLPVANLPVIEDELTPEFFTANRQRLLDTLPNRGAFVVFSAPQKLRSNDIDYRYHQDPDFYYLTGIREPNAMLVLLKDSAADPIYSAHLFVETKDAKKEQWTGKMLGIEGAKELSGIQLVHPNTAFKHSDLLNRSQTIYSNKYLNIERDNKSHPGDLSSMVRHFETKANRIGVEVLSNEGEDLLAYLRQFKSEKERIIMQRAIDITCEAHKAVMQQVKPGMTEYQLEALINYTFRSNGAQGEAFPSIVAAGRNGAIMHYTQNSSLLIPGDMVVIDIGAQYEGYAADVTRTIPISGTFSEEQAAIYQLVLDAQTVAIRYATPGYKFWTPHEEAYRTIGKGLIKLGIIENWNEIGNYFIHGTSHYLGLDVHDCGLYASLKPGQVITVEPGIYIPEGSPCDPKWWNIYVRIEDDLLITDGAATVMSASAPKTIEAIEKLMAGDQANAQ